MNLDEFFFRSKKKQKDFAVTINVSAPHVGLLSNKKCCPSLLIAMNIVHATGGIVTFEDLLQDDDKKKLLKYLATEKIVATE